jgi:N-acetylglucosamine-6-phosphate deacetylase
VRLGVAAALVDGAVVAGDVAVADGVVDALGLAGAGAGLAVPGFVDVQVNVIDGACRLADGTLAGSTVTMDRSVRELVALGASTAEAAWAASGAPARLLVRDDGGRLAPGLPADIAVLDDALYVTRTLVAGIEVFAA